MNKKDFKIIFLGHQFGQIIREKLQGAGFSFVDPESKQVDLIVVGFYGKILSQKTLAIPKYGALNVHPSLLPKYRGPSPVQAAILNNETKTGVTIIFMDEKADHGPIIAAEVFKIGDRKFTTPELTKELWELGGDLLVKTIPKWVAGKIKPKEQDHKKATYTKILTKEDGHIDWAKSAEEIERQIRAFTPWPGSFTFWENKRINIISGDVSQLLLSQHLPTGQTFITPDRQLAVQTGSGIFVVNKVQIEGKSEITSREFLLGHKEIADKHLT